MPIYEYKCSSCGLKFEKIQSFSASSEIPCPKCNHTAQRLISQASFILKGTGWYVTDHPSKGRKEGMKKESSTPKSVTPKKSSDKSDKTTKTKTTPAKTSTSVSEK